MQNKTGYKRLIFKFCFLILFSSSLMAQKNQLEFEHISLEEGLSQGCVVCIVQDSKGYIWCGTYDGLNKYDGYSFTTYKNDPDNPNSLSQSTVNSIHEDQSGTLWIGTGGGLNRFDRQTEQFKHYTYDPDNERSLSHNIVFSIYEDRSGVLWIGTDGGGLNKFDRDKEQFIHYKHDPDNSRSLSQDVVYSIYEDSFGILWIGTDGGGLNKFNRDKEIFTHYEHDPDDSLSLSNDVVWSIFEDRSGTLWIGTDGGVNKFDRDKELFKQYKHDANNLNSLSDNSVRSIYEDKSGTLWIVTFGGGLNKFDRDKEQFINYMHNPSDPGSLSLDACKSIYEDRSGIIWIGTDGGGFNIFDSKKENFTHYKHHANDPNSLSDNSVRSIYEDQSGTLWVGTWRGLNKFDRDKEQFTHYKHNANDPNSISDSYVLSIYEDRSGIFWIGTGIGGINRFDREKEQFTHYMHDDNDPGSLSDNFVQSIYEDRFGSFWVGTGRGGLNKFDRDKEQFLHYIHDENNPNSLSHNQAYIVYEDKSGTLWIGTWGGGVNKFDRQNEQFTHYMHDPDDPNSLSDNLVRSIYEDTSGTLWIGTGGGLNKFDKKTEQFKRYREKDGLPNGIIYGIIEDNNNNLWLSTNYGISRFNWQTEKFRNYDVKDGLQSNEFSGGAYFKGKDGKILFGGINGLTIFHPDSIKDNPYIPPVVITDFQIFNQSVPIQPEGNEGKAYFIPRHISEMDKMILSYKESVFSFEFSSLHYAAPEKNLYAYKMDGFDKDWVKTDAKRRFATYTNLDAGKYTFRVKGSNKDGVWNEEGTSIRITITPPPWRTWWAYSLYVIMLISGIWIFIFLRLRNTERQKHILEIQVAKRTEELSKSNQELEISMNKAEAANRAKSTFLSNMSHELRTPLNSILGYAQIYTRDSDLPTSTKKGLNVILTSGNHLLNLINDLLDLAKIEAKKIILTESDFLLNQCLNDISSIIQIRIQEKGITFINKFSPDLPQYIRTDRKRLSQVILNLLSNSVKFTNSGSITFEVFPVGSTYVQSTPTKSDIFRFRVSDTGIGIPKDKLEDVFSAFTQINSGNGRGEGTGLGLTISRQIVQLMGGNIQVESKINEGSAFWFDLKLKEVSEADETKIATPLNIIGYKGDKKSILIADDNEENRYFLKDLLQSLNFRVLEAINGREAVDLAIKNRPEMIFMDYIMPEMDGLEAKRLIKESENLRDIKIIIVSASTNTEKQKEILDSGVDDFLPKPVNVDELIKKMDIHLNLDWEYTEKSKPVSKQKIKEENILYPSKQVLKKLNDFAKRYDYKGIEKQLEKIRKEDNRFLPFINRIRQLTEDYRMDEIIELFQKTLKDKI